MDLVRTLKVDQVHLEDFNEVISGICPGTSCSRGQSIPFASGQGFGA
jgi:hypothetical protein